MATVKVKISDDVVARGAPAPRKPRRRAYARKTDIVLEAAERVFLESGFANTSMDAVAELAQVSKRTVYNNYKNKEDLFAAVIRKRCDQVLPQNLDGVDIRAKDPEPILMGLATSFLTSIFSKPQVELYQTVVAASRQFPEIGRIMYDGPILHSQAIFAEVLKAQIDLGNLVLPDPSAAAAQLIALLKTNVHMRLTFNQPMRTSKRQILQSAESSVRLFLNGARAPKRTKASSARG